MINSTSTRMVTKEELIKAIENAFSDTDISENIAVVTTVDFGEDRRDKKIVQTFAFEKVLKF